MSEMFTFQFGYLLGMCAGMAGMAFMWWMHGGKE